MTKIFFDTNILLDVILSRDPEEIAKKIICKTVDSDNIRIYASYLSMANMAYILRRQGMDSVRNSIAEVMKWCNIMPCNDMQIIEAAKEDSADFEDELQIMCAEYGKCDLIITRNEKHFRTRTELPVLSPEEYAEYCL